MDWWMKKKNKKKLILGREKRIRERGAMLLEDLIECCDGKSNPIKFFSADEILKATDNFGDSNRVSELSNDGYEWYSGKNENHHKLLITKDVYRFDTYGEGTFCRDIAVSSMVSGHKNFLKLVGCCLEFEDPVLVYHGVKKHYNLDISEQPWKRRMKVAEDIATGLSYLHTAFPRPFVHSSMTLKSILLDEDGVAKLTDFSDCVSIPEGETFVEVNNNFWGLSGYKVPIFMMSGVVSEKTDVFAIGMSIKMLLIGEKGCFDDDDSATMSETNDQRRQFSYWLFKFADPKMLEMMGEISEEELCQMKAFLMLSLRCMGHKGEVPTMVEVAKELNKIQKEQ